MKKSRLEYFLTFISHEHMQIRNENNRCERSKGAKIKIDSAHRRLEVQEPLLTPAEYNGTSERENQPKVQGYFHFNKDFLSGTVG
jgi:hypothetical protein